MGNDRSYMGGLVAQSMAEAQARERVAGIYRMMQTPPPGFTGYESRTMKLTPDNVQSTLLHCLFLDEEISDPHVLPEGGVAVKGITANFGFHPERLVEKTRDITTLLNQLPAGFHEDGIGQPFQSACMNADGAQWGEHQHMEMLMCLGLATGLVEIPEFDGKSLSFQGLPVFRVVTG